jgi:hypothetical protein
VTSTRVSRSPRFRAIAFAAVLAIVLAGCGGSIGTSSSTAPASAANPASAGATAAPSTVALPAGAQPVNPKIAISAVTPIDPTRIDAPAWAAIEALGASGAGTPHSAHSHGHGAGSAHIELPMFDGDAVAFGDQWLVAQRSTANYDSVEKAEALGYVRASTPGPGVGTHYVLWPQIAKPFDVAHPSMLLFDERKQPAVLVGYSYWIQSATEPVGFAGNADDWHQHTGLCVVNGWVDREEATGPDQCAGIYLAGGDLWMLHAWVVPAYSNPDGRFETYNPMLCPPVASSPDFERCPS